MVVRGGIHLGAVPVTSVVVGPASGQGCQFFNVLLPPFCRSSRSLLARLGGSSPLRLFTHRERSHLDGCLNLAGHGCRIIVVKFLACAKGFSGRIIISKAHSSHKPLRFFCCALLGAAGNVVFYSVTCRTLKDSGMSLK